MASYAEVEEVLRATPFASLAWADALHAAGLSRAALMQLLVTMKHDAESPLREAEQGMLSKEIVRLSANRGVGVADSAMRGRMRYRVRAALTPAEQSRVSKLVDFFCQPEYVPSKRFGSNGHVVMNVVRRIASAYNVSKVPVGATICEVGPDVLDWMLQATPAHWESGNQRLYKGARPCIRPRDTLRMEWQSLANLLESNPDGKFAPEQVRKASLLKKSFSQVFDARRVEECDGSYEYIISHDSNYDISFEDVVRAMVGLKARAWLGFMERAKGLTARTRLTEGVLELMGASYRVDWKADRIDFRHRESNAFGYSHRASEYMKYESNNGQVLTCEQGHFVYSILPESNSELLFFSFNRVPTVPQLQEPSFAALPYARKLRITSVWSVGEERSGVPQSFSPVEFHVDPLTFQKIWEKRRAQDHRGNLAFTVNLVRSTNVRFWLNGAPVGATERVAARLAEATAVAVEVLASEGRQLSNLCFEKAMREHRVCVTQASSLLRLFTSVVELRVVAGLVAQPVLRAWWAIRDRVVDKLLAPIGELRVSVRLEGAVCKLPNEAMHVAVPASRSRVDGCKCGEIAEVQAALAFVNEKERAELEAYVRELGGPGLCSRCVPLVDDSIGQDSTTEVEDSEEETAATLDTDDSRSLCSEFTETEECAGTWRDADCAHMLPARAMEEYVRLECFLTKSLLSELAVDCAKLFPASCIPSDNALKERSTARTKHAAVRVQAGRVVETRGWRSSEYSAIYDFSHGKLHAVTTKGQVKQARVADGWYYTCNRLKVCNGQELASAVEYALDHGQARDHRATLKVFLGVPGAGKTYEMMSKLAEERRLTGCAPDFLVLAVTKKSAATALRYGKQFGIPLSALKNRVMTLDRYLMHVRSKATVLRVDEFAMVHFGKVEAAITLSGADDVRVFGDAKQIPFDSFCGEFKCEYSKLGRGVKRENVEFKAETHRNPDAVCAAFLDQYPAYYPCDCCGDRVEKQKKKLSFKRIRTIADLGGRQSDTRYHTYKQDEKEELHAALGFSKSLDELKEQDAGGLATVHEDQGTTHDKVLCVRLSTVYDKHASERNPSLYNRVNYVLTDITRVRESYEYATCCQEEDEVIRRVKLSQDPGRLQLVADKKGLVADFDVLSMLE